jgi:putative ABC transport system ATP-binding protein
MSVSPQVSDVPPTDRVALLRAEGLTKLYPDGEVRALDGVDLTIERGEFVAIVGPSGSGKSTLLQLLGLLDEPSEGEVYFEGQSVSRLANTDRLRAERIGFVFQSFHLLPMLTALENVQVPMFESALPHAARAEKAARLLADVGMQQRAAHLPLRLSVGERQRVAIARSLANDPALLLADEPTGNLDTRTGEEILELFFRLHAQANLTVVLITHDPRVAARANRVIHLRDGKVEADERR